VSLSRADVIGFVALPAAEPGSVHLVIIDELDWVTPDEHLTALKARLNCSLHVITSGRLASLTQPRLPPTPQFTIVLAFD
jgi:hypothetical protein